MRLIGGVDRMCLKGFLKADAFLRQSSRDILEQLFGLKTVSIYSGDRTNPKLDIYGVKERLDVVSIIRERVEYNKRRKGIYEITNR